MEKLKKLCDPDEVAVKSFFLGPSAENADWLKNQVNDFLNSWFQWRTRFSTGEGKLISDEDKMLDEFKAQQGLSSDIIHEISKRFEDEIPKFSPRYIGHMFSEISMPALLGHMITLLHNPNNISKEASRVGTEIEKQAIQYLSELVGYAKGFGHFTSGGTLANFEFLFRARERLSRWLATSIDNENKNMFEASTLGWQKFQDLASKSPKTDENKYLLYENVTTSYREISRRLGFDMKPPVLLVSSSKHYSWPKAMHYLGLGEANIKYIGLDKCGRMSVTDLRDKINDCRKQNTPLLGVVAIVGTTELGTIDPIDDIVNLLREFRDEHASHIWLHLDAAYGGFFRSIINTDTISMVDDLIVKNLKAMSHADSVTLDPHKLGYVPYSSGTFICKNPEDYFTKPFTGPYIISDKDTTGNFTIEGSRSAAGAVATYASMKSFEGSDGYARILNRSILAKEMFQKELNNTGIRILIPEGLDTNILCFSVLGDNPTLSENNKLNLGLYEKIQKEGPYWISKTTLTLNHFKLLIQTSCDTNNVKLDTDEMVLLRLTLMNPFVHSKESNTNHASAFAKILIKYFDDNTKTQLNGTASKG